jgi:hypothetical protein
VHVPARSRRGAQARRSGWPSVGKVTHAIRHRSHNSELTSAKSNRRRQRTQGAALVQFPLRQWRRTGRTMRARRMGRRQPPQRNSRQQQKLPRSKMEGQSARRTSRAHAGGWTSLNEAARGTAATRRAQWSRFEQRDAMSPARVDCRSSCVRLVLDVGVCVVAVRWSARHLRPAAAQRWTALVLPLPTHRRHREQQDERGRRRLCGAVDRRASVAWSSLLASFLRVPRSLLPAAFPSLLCSATPARILRAGTRRRTDVLLLTTLAAA